MARKYKHLSIPPDEFEPIAELTRRYNKKEKANVAPPKIVVMAARRMLADMKQDEGK